MSTPHDEPKGEDAARIHAYIDEEMRAAATYRALAGQVDGMPRQRLLQLADEEEAQARRLGAALERDGHAADLSDRKLGMSGRMLLAITRRAGLAWAVPFIERAHQAEADRYEQDPDSDPLLLAEERVHLEIVEGLAPRWRTRASGTIRAGVFGISDGIVSNLALVMGMVGAGSTPSVVVLAGIAGLLAGAMSMASGEYVSVASQAELLRADGESEEAIAAAGSPLRVAATSFATFAVGAIVPVVPFLLGSGVVAGVAAFVACALVLAVIGALLALFSDRTMVFAVTRQVGLGIGAAIATLLIGRLIGVAIS